ncbi:MAG: hypothetical protein D6775_10630 [Caldilineae bacterium]|nr:MAG: hypothetical protein D6775_10630 [Caldilineae bacterium]
MAAGTTPATAAKGKERAMTEQTRTFERFGILERIEHFLLLLSFTLLAITGLPQKFATWSISKTLIRGFGGIEGTRSVHHTAAVLLIILSIFHVLYVFYKIYVLRRPLSMLPGLQDVRDGIHMVAYNLGLSPTKPAMDRYNFAEKIEYWAVVWGTLIMGLTGYMLWNPIATTRILPGEFIPAAKAAHGFEAILAVLSILTWHVYHVHLKYFNRSMFTGRLSYHEMEEEHAAELKRRLQGAERPLPPPHERWRRSRLYLPVAGVLAAFALLFTYYFFTIEQTAITTLPPQENVNVYIPDRLPKLPTATPIPVRLAEAGVPERLQVERTPEPPAISSHPVDDARGDCLSCHNVYGYIAPAPIEHAERTNDICLDCHAVAEEVARR